MPQMIPVSSSNLSAVGYDSSTQTLYISFHHGGLYAYFDVPEPIYRGLMQAPSKGQYHHRYIKNNYQYQRL